MLSMLNWEDNSLNLSVKKYVKAKILKGKVRILKDISKKI